MATEKIGSRFEPVSNIHCATDYHGSIVAKVCDILNIQHINEEEFWSSGKNTLGKIRIAGGWELADVVGHLAIGEISGELWYRFRVERQCRDRRAEPGKHSPVR